jgi:hypothetical protein
MFIIIVERNGGLKKNSFLVFFHARKKNVGLFGPSAFLGASELKLLPLFPSTLNC